MAKMDLDKGKRFAVYYIKVVLCVFLCLMIVVFPYYAPEGYKKLGEHKYIFFRDVELQCLLMILPALACLLIFQWKNLKWKQLSGTDRAMIFYAVAVILSYVCTEWKEKAFWGTEGWSMGMVSQLLFVAIYFVVSRFGGKTKCWYMVMVVASSGVFLIGILNRFSIYPFGLGVNEPSNFISTIGNINWFCGYWSVVFPIGLVSYWSGRGGKRWIRIVHAFYVVLGYVVGIVQGSSSAFLVLGAVLLLLFTMSLGDDDHLFRWIELMLLMVVGSLVVSIVKLAFPDALNYQNGIEEWMTKPAVCGSMLVGTAVGYVATWYWIRKNKCSVRMDCRRVHGIIIVSLTLTGLLIISAIIYCKIAGFSLDVSWGNGRGAALIVSGKMFAAMSFVQKLLGVGPDCFDSCMYDSPEIAEMLSSVYGTARLTNAHNELLTTLINIGVCGAISYAAIFLTALLRQFREGKRRELLLVSAVCIYSYVIHNTVSFQQVVSTPLVFLFIGFGESELRKNERLDKLY